KKKRDTCLAVFGVARVDEPRPVQGAVTMARAKRRAQPAERIYELDWLMLAVVCLCCVGLTMAVSVQGAKHGAEFAVREQGAKLIAGLVALVTMSLFPLGLLRRYAKHLFAVGIVLVLATLFFVDERKGATRWLRFGGTSFQPVEFARIALIVLTATVIAKVGARRAEFRAGFIPVLTPAVILAAALALQPDLGNALLTMTLACAMAVSCGVALRWFFLAALPLIPALVVAVRGYQLDRIHGFLGDEPPLQVQRSLTAIGSGGFAGTGVGNGWMKMGFVPEAQNDFVFAIIGEELGLVGAIFVLGLFALIGYVGFRLVLTLRDPFHRYVVFGCTFAICMQALVNLLVTTGMAPAKGIDLPLVSSGGTNLVATLAMVGLIGNAARADSAV
ncbi:MAG: FtsW/RodA/SpoVE family cell cycle protein, partial [Planctomycetes bacterium]|nr:FtsW/RodA/SpoVE family cell cycle protein [Planctomycetota bacterium]